MVFFTQKYVGSLPKARNSRVIASIWNFDELLRYPLRILSKLSFVAHKYLKLVTT